MIYKQKKIKFSFSEMAQALYFSLVLIALCSLSECSQRRYHYINTEMTWTEAQRYCRKYYTDLATVNNMKHMNQLMKSLNDGRVNNSLAIWIGLENTGVYEWKWSLGDRVKYQNWKDQASDNTNNCAVIKNGKWSHQACDVSMSFICYNESSKRHIIETSHKTWREAQSFCRQHHTDLTSVKNKTDNQLIHNIINNTHVTEAWIGLFSDSWEWSDNSDSAFRYWMTGEPNGGETQQCTEISVRNQSQWNDAGCQALNTFVCHEDEKLILIKQNLSWTKALMYCRENHVDLLSVDSEETELWVTEVIQQASTDQVWLGLRHSCSVDIWFWVNGQIVCWTDRWAPGNETADGCECEERSGAVQSGGDHHWISLPESHKLNFICIKKHKE